MKNKEHILDHDLRRVRIINHDVDQTFETVTSQDSENDKYYEDLINGVIAARTGFNKAIQNLTKKDAGLVLAMIGMDHPAAGVVYRYLVQQKREQSTRGSWMLFRKRDYESFHMDGFNTGRLKGGGLLENKKEITARLKLLLAATRAGERIQNMELSEDEKLVTVRWKNGYVQKVNVEADSGTAMIIDVLKAIS